MLTRRTLLAGLAALLPAAGLRKSPVLASTAHEPGVVCHIRRLVDQLRTQGADLSEWGIVVPTSRSRELSEHLSNRYGRWVGPVPGTAPFGVELFYLDDAYMIFPMKLTDIFDRLDDLAAGRPTKQHYLTKV